MTRLSRCRTWCEAMANEATGEKYFCLYSCLPFNDLGEVNFVRICVKPDVTEEEKHKLCLRSNSLPSEQIPLIGTGAFNIATSFVSMGSMVFCLGGSKLTEQNLYEVSNEVRKFDPSSLEFIPIPCCNMIQPRQFAASVSSHGILYIFGGVLPNPNHPPWAEYLDTTKPEIEQQWMPLDLPVSRVSMISWPFAIPFNKAGTVFLIGCRKKMDQGAILFDTTDMSSREYNFVGIPFASAMRDPVIVDRTMFWMEREYLEAYDLDTHVHYSTYTGDSVLSDFGYRFSSTRWGPLLVHLENNLFCFFTLYRYQGLEDSAPFGVVECTKFRATKVPVKPEHQYWHWPHFSIKPVGYQSYRCDPMRALYGVLPIMRG